MRESYKRFVKTWIRFANTDSEGHESGSFWFSKDSFRGFVSWRNFHKIRFMDSFRDTIFIRFVLWIRFVTHFNETNESWRILANLYYINVLWMEVKDSRILLFFKRFVSWIRFVLRCSKDSFRGFVSSYGVQKIRFVDSFCDTIFVRFVSWIRFVRPKISKDSIRFVSEGFVYESRILTNSCLNLT